METSTQEIKTALKEALAEENKAGIQPIIIPPLADTSNEVDTPVLTEDVVDSLLRHKQHKRVKERTTETYRKHLYRFAQQFSILPLEMTMVRSGSSSMALLQSAMAKSCCPFDPLAYALLL